MKTEFCLKRITKDDAAKLLLEYHYLRKESKGFKSGFNYGLLKGNELVGAIIFTGFPVPELSYGCFGLDRNDQDGLFELSRLVLEPSVQMSEPNLASWFVSRAIKMLRKETSVRAILSYADDNHHSGTVYRACNFSYYGLTAKKKDFFVKKPDGTFVKQSRGGTKGKLGEWRPRSRKHRFLMVFDKKLKCKWEKYDT